VGQHAAKGRPRPGNEHAVGRGRDDAGHLLISPTTSRPLTSQAIYGLIARLARAADVGELGPHGLRTSMVTLVLDSGMPLRDVQDFARHADPRTTAMHPSSRFAVHGTPASGRDRAVMTSWSRTP
jgi:integrase